jgi:hypothetical protein
MKRLKRYTILGIFLGGFAAESCGGQTKVLPPPPPKAPPPITVTAAAAQSSERVGGAMNRPPLSTLASDEGMWLLSDFPSRRVQDRYGFAPSQTWLDHVRLSSVRVGGCSGSFVSPKGLVMTNHHCGQRCLSQVSTAHENFVANGFYAKSPKEELKCPEIEALELIEVGDVTARVTTATQGLDGASFHERQKAELSKIEKECATADDLRCDVVTLYRGGRYHLYKYRRFQDVRLVFAPEFATAFFGGDPDNFMFPRYDLDVTFMRVYEHDQPLEQSHYLEWSASGAKDGDLTFVAGHPHATSRESTVAELEYLRDVALPSRALRLSESRGILTEFQSRSAEHKRISSSDLFSIENSLKALKGALAALRDRDVWRMKVGAEDELRGHVNSDPAMEPFRTAWEAIARAEERMRSLRVPYQMLEQAVGFWSKSFGQARQLIRAAEELSKPNEQRLREYGDSQIPALRQAVLSRAPIYEDLETVTLTHSLTLLREELGPDDPVVRKVLGKSSPAEVAVRAVKGTKLRDDRARKALFDGGKSVVDASKDPMIELAKLVDADARAIRKRYEEEVEAVVKKNSELIAKARFRIYGTSVYPDATGTLRLSFGQVRGWVEGEKVVAPITNFGGAFERATGRDPFALPRSWLDKQSRLDLATPLDFCTTNDIIGGNSGSPVIDKDARIVGLIFDGNIHSLGGDYFYDAEKNRAVAVASAGLVQALDKIYGASRILGELSMAGGHGPEPAH